MHPGREAPIVMRQEAGVAGGAGERETIRGTQMFPGRSAGSVAAGVYRQSSV